MKMSFLSSVPWSSPNTVNAANAAADGTTTHTAAASTTRSTHNGGGASEAHRGGQGAAQQSPAAGGLTLSPPMHPMHMHGGGVGGVGISARTAMRSVEDDDPDAVPLTGAHGGGGVPSSSAATEDDNSSDGSDYDDPADGEGVLVGSPSPSGGSPPLAGGSRGRRSSQAASGRRRRGGRGGGEPFTSLATDSILSTVWHRISILVSLLLLQSLSQFILERYEALLSQHVIVPLFLTMLVGAGGNAGNQSAVRSITGLVSGEFKMRDFLKVIRKELVVGLINATIVAAIGFSRVYYFYGHRDLFWSTMAITASLFCIVLSSVVLGTSLPFLLGKLGYDKEHAAPIIQVVMDITGVLITCLLCTAMIPDSEHTTKAH